MQHRCGKHVVLSAPASAGSQWVGCAVHYLGSGHLRERFTRIVALEYGGEEILMLGWIIDHAMLDPA
ncbi:hypothetical protein Cs7R123_57070 [Catellatospora sp. TT07R-123]|uniref:hypothetical protein n=1 Tax=Catellatospora sp. TT07R-123 TaxID=2733863 RepID=UPI001B2F0512|nr:hypothetical protein [Catellatospora sp. TT07R-123]GHJ48365.1 hypothetical protein Cs7R123_57070 [Catellatospora sp. TT07R-123]